MPKELTAFRVDREVMDGVRRLKTRDGVPLSVQVDRALRAWLRKQGIEVKAAGSDNRGRSRQKEKVKQ
jgi:hypothetical protein